jgi:hypothetical protein
MFVLSVEHQATISSIMGDFHEAMADLHQEVYSKGKYVLETYYRMRVQIGRMEAIEHTFPGIEDSVIFQSVCNAMHADHAEIVDKIKIA